MRKHIFSLLLAVCMVFPMSMMAWDSAPDGNDLYDGVYDRPIVPCGYELTEHNRRNAPCSWKLMAKLNEGDAWTVIDEQIDNYWTSLPEYKAVKFDLKEKDKPYQYIRWECTKRIGDDSGFTLQRFNFLF